MLFLLAYTILIALVVSFLSTIQPFMDIIDSYTIGFYENDDIIPFIDETYSEDTDSEEDIDYQHKQEEKRVSHENKTQHGYEKDGFVVDDEEDSDSDYIPSDEDIGEHHDNSTDEDETY